MSDAIEAARALRAQLQADPHRPCWHFVATEGLARPFDPNGAIWWRGRYHLFYIFQRHQESEPRVAHCWGHASSADLLHWVIHPTALEPGEGDAGIFSGNAFVNRDGVPTILYHGVGAGNCLAVAADDELLRWRKLPTNPVVPNPAPGSPEAALYASWDPHGWVEGGVYHGCFGGFGTVRATHFTGDELAGWQYDGPFIDGADRWLDADEDVSCPDFFALGDRHALIFISHVRGAQWFIGDWSGHVFRPERHGRLNWPGGGYFAPESLLDGRGRRLLWAWVLDPRPLEVQTAAGWSGMMGLPRVLSLGDDGDLHIAPAEELTQLRGEVTAYSGPPVHGECLWSEAAGDSLELAVEWQPADTGRYGVIVRRSPDGAEQTRIEYDAPAGQLRVDFSRASLDASLVYRTWAVTRPADEADAERTVTEQVAPLRLAPGEPLRLRVFLDRCLLEVFANDRQCLTQCLYPTRADSTGVALFREGGPLSVTRAEAWPLAATNAW